MPEQNTNADATNNPLSAVGSIPGVPDTSNPPDELVLLKQRADKMGITYHPNIGIAKLKEKIDAALEGRTLEDDTTPPAVTEAPKVLTAAERSQLAREEALRLVRVVVNCMNPAKSLWEGEIFSVSNRYIGDVKKYVPFNNEAGWHIPYCIYQQLLERQCQIFYTVVDKRTGMKTRKGKLIKEFNVSVLPDLTTEELAELARQQATNNSID